MSLRAGGFTPGAWRFADDDAVQPAAGAGHLFTLNLRTHALSHLCVADQAERKKEHDMRALKRQDIDTLWQGTPS